MRTLEWLPPEKRKRIAQETRDLYAPLAHRFGMAKMRWELEDLAFKHLETEEYKALAKQVAQKRGEREELIKQMAEPLVARMAQAGIKDVDVTGRPKHLWSIYKKMKQREKPYEEIYDLLAIRVLVQLRPRLLPRARRDPRRVDAGAGAHQGLHRAAQVERVPVAAHDGLRPRAPAVRGADPHARHASHGGVRHRRALAVQGGRQDRRARSPPAPGSGRCSSCSSTPRRRTSSSSSSSSICTQDEIFVFTPTGDVIQLPKGATPIDFAFAVHTEIGLHCAGARVNGRIAPLSRALRNSETVEIITSTDREADARLAGARPHRPRAPQDPPGPQTRSADVGREARPGDARSRDQAAPADQAERRRHAHRARARSASPTRPILLASIGQGDVNVTLALKHLYPERRGVGAGEAERRSSGSSTACAATKGVRIQGVDGLMVRYAQCCQPVPGDPVVGYVTRGRGVSIHRADCPNLLVLAHEPERRLEIDWQEAQGERFVVRLALEGNDRRGLYADLAAAVSATGTDIKSMDLRSTDGRTLGSMLVEVENLTHLEKIIRAARRVKGVTEVARRERVTTPDN